MFSWLNQQVNQVIQGFDPDIEYTEVQNRTGGTTSDEQIDQDVRVFFQRLSPLDELENLDPTTGGSDARNINP